MSEAKTGDIECCLSEFMPWVLRDFIEKYGVIIGENT